MKLIEKKNQHRRDFTGVYECESCNTKEEISSYDDRNFHDNVIPKMKCKHCEVSSESLGIVNEKVTTKYSEHEVV